VCLKKINIIYKNIDLNKNFVFILKMSLIVCKKCGGQHITLKCGKEPKPIETKPIKSNYKDRKPEAYLDKRKIVTVKISNLPEDITVYELEKLMNDWGSIARVNLNYSVDNKIGFVDFFFKFF